GLSTLRGGSYQAMEQKTCRVKTAEGLRYIDFRGQRMVWNPDAQGFVPVSRPIFRGPHLNIGLTDAERGILLSQLGQNKISIAVPSWGRAIFSEFSRRYFLYQMLCLAVWFQFYYWTAGVFVLTCAIGASVI